MSEAINQLDIVACVAAGYHIGLLAEQVVAARPVVRPTTVAVLSLETLLGLNEHDATPQQQLTLTIGDQYSVDITISCDMMLQTLAISDIHPLPPLLAARCTLNGLAAFAQLENRLILIIDTNLIADKLQAPKPEQQTTD